MSKATKPTAAAALEGKRVRGGGAVKTQSSEPQDLTVRSLTITDSKDRPRIRLRVDDQDHPEVSLLDRDGASRLVLSVANGGDANDGGWPAMSLRDSKGHVCFAVEADDGALHIDGHADGRELFLFEVTKNSGPTLHW